MVAMVQKLNLQVFPFCKLVTDKAVSEETAPELTMEIFLEYRVPEINAFVLAIIPRNFFRSVVKWKSIIHSPKRSYKKQRWIIRSHPWRESLLWVFRTYFSLWNSSLVYGSTIYYTSWYNKLCYLLSLGSDHLSLVVIRFYCLWTLHVHEPKERRLICLQRIYKCWEKFSRNHQCSCR